MPRGLLSINAGSSSLKFALFEVGAAGRITVVSHGQIEGIGAAPHLLVKDAAGAVLADRRWPQDGGQTHEMLLGQLLDWVDTHLGQESLTAVGHRVVHGGATHVMPERVTAELMRQLEALTPMAPLHQPHSLAPIRAIAAARPGLPQVACFDTAFHHGMPTVATRFALPRAYEAEGVRRYGFHGLSYESVVHQLAVLAPDLAAGRVIAAHLGNGASLCAMQGGHSRDTTMGFTALDGLMMGTRCGALDPGVVLYLMQQHGMTGGRIEDLLYHHSGLLGVSGISADMRELLASKAETARDAIDLFVYRIAREASALVNSLGGLDGIVFTGGIGEHAPEIRAAVCDRLRWLGVRLDVAANATPGVRISAADSSVAVLVLPADEEAVIGRQTLDIVG
jgi:acetate kinase